MTGVIGSGGRNATGGLGSRCMPGSGRDSGLLGRSRPGAGGRVLPRAALAALMALASLALPAPASGQGAGSQASTLLRLAPGPRALALGHAMTAVRDPVALEYNPAAAVAGGLGASYQGLPVGASAGAAGVTFGAGETGVVGVSLRFIDYGTIDVYEPSPDLPVGVPTGETATGGELSALVGGGVAVGPARLGLAARWLRLDVAGLSDNAFGVDAGVLLEPTPWLAVGAAYQGLGTDVEAGRSAPVLRTVRAGAALRHTVLGLDGLLTVEGRRREARTGLGTGLELRGGGERLEAAFRIGYETKPDPGDAFSALTFGGAVRLDGLTVELAYRALGPLGSTRQVGVRYRF